MSGNQPNYRISGGKPIFCRSTIKGGISGTGQALNLLRDNYPEFVSKQVFINVPWWYVAFYTMMSPFMTQRTKSKFVFAGPSKTAETLFKYVSPEQVPIQYGGLIVDYCDCNPDVTVDDTATVLNL